MRFLPVVAYIFCFYLEVIHCVIKQEFNYFTTDKYLQVFLFFSFLLLLNKASGALLYKYLCGQVFISLGQMPRTEIVTSQSKSIFNLKRNFQTVFQFSFFLNHFTLPLLMHKSFSCYPIPPNFGTDILFNFSHSSYFKWHIFMVLISDVLKTNVSSLVLIEQFMCHILPFMFLNWVLSILYLQKFLVYSSYKFSVICYINICMFIFLKLFFDEQKIKFWLNISYHFFLYGCFLCLRDVYLTPGHRDIPILMFYFKKLYNISFQFQVNNISQTFFVQGKTYELRFNFFICILSYTKLYSKPLVENC